MDKKKLYLIIGGVVLAVVIAVVLIISFGGNSEPSTVDTPTISDTVEGTTGETVGDVVDNTETTEPSDETTGDNDVTDDGSGNEDSKTDDKEDAEKPEETTKSDDSDEFVIPEIPKYEDVKDIIDGDGENIFIDEGGDKSVVIEGDGETTTIIKIESENDIIVSTTTEDGTCKRVIYDENGDVISQSVIKDEEVVYFRSATNYGYYTVDNERCIYKEFDKNGNQVAEATFKVVNGKRYVLSGTAYNGTKITVKYHSQDSTVISELILDGANYFHCKWSSAGNSDDNLTYYEYHGSNGSSVQSGSINLFMLPSPPVPIVDFRSM